MLKSALDDRRRERGQILIMAALSMAVMMAFAALAIDLGFQAEDRRDLQNDADAMALAGASQICEGGACNGAADTEARTWGTLNDVEPDEIIGNSFSYGVTCSGAVKPNTITVRLTRTRETFLARVMGIDTTGVSVCATAARFSPGGGTGMAPFGVEDDCIFGDDGIPGTGEPDEIQPGAIITIKYDANNGEGEPCGSNQGNFWPLAIDAPGAGPNCGDPTPADGEDRKFKEAVCFGAITPLCTPAGYAEESGGCETSVDTQTGNVVGPVKSSIEYLVNNAPPGCRNMGGIVEQDADGTYMLTNQCNPFLEHYEGVSLVKMIPVLSGLFPDANGKKNVPIVNFLIVVILPSQINEGNWCKGSDCDLKAQVIEIGVNPGMLRAALDDDAWNNFSALIE